MKNWKKWAAGLFALSLCLTSVSLPAAAEGEEDIALIADTSEETPVADGTPDETAGDGEADAEEEATRTETQEEIETQRANVEELKKALKDCKDEIDLILQVEA